MSAHRSRLSVAAEAWRTFRGEPPGRLAFLAARLLIVPLRDLDGDLRGLHGKVLSLGCGHGLLERYVAIRNDRVVIEGVELDAQRVAAAARTAARSPRVTVREADVLTLGATGTFDAVLAVDVLHHLPADRQAPVLGALAQSLRPGGTCLVKDIATRPRWRWAVNRLHDRLVAGPGPIACRSPAEMAGMLRVAGLEVEDVRRMGRASPYPHYLVRARRPGG